MTRSKYGSRRVERDVQVASSYLAGNEPHVHFGTHGQLAYDVRVRWLGGEEEAFGDFPVRMTAVLRRGNGAPALAWPFVLRPARTGRSSPGTAALQAAFATVVHCFP